MGKISIDDAFEKISSPKKETSDHNGVFSFLKNIPLISFKELIRRIKVANIYRVIREQFIRFYLQRTVACKGKDLFIIWQPLYFVLAKIALVVTLSALLFVQYPHLSSWLNQGLLFFRLHEIYNFTFPEPAFFDTVAKGILLFVIGYYGLFFAFHQIQALFSALVVSSREKKLFYIRSLFIKKDLYVFSLPEMDYFALKQNILFRLLGIGTILLKNKSGETFHVRSLKNAAQAVRRMIQIKGKGSFGNEKRRDPLDE